jgi:hypothetical protein
MKLIAQCSIIKKLTGKDAQTNRGGFCGFNTRIKHLSAFSLFRFILLETALRNSAGSMQKNILPFQTFWKRHRKFT